MQTERSTESVPLEGDSAIERLVLFGATGDLAGRYLLPALAELLEAGQLQPGFEVIGAARDDLDDDDFRRHAAERLDEHAPDVPAAVRTSLLELLHYRPVDLGDPSSISSLIGDDQRPVAIYLALPPATYTDVTRTLCEVDLPAGSRVAFEKPFGQDLESAVELNEMVARLAGEAGEDAVFRVDHVLGMPTLHNLLGARLANRVLEALWNSTHIEEVDIVWDETIALEGRAGYYDEAGALQDVVQNHLLQILCLVAMEPPVDLSARELRDRKVELLSAVRIPSPEEATRQSTRARYIRGTLAPPPEGAGTEVPSYVDEEGVDASNDTETFAEIVLDIENPRWSGTRFLLRTGKALTCDRKGVVVRFRPTDSWPFDPGTTPPRNELRLGLDGPESFALHLTGSAPGPPAHLAPLVLEADLPADELPAYSHVLLSVLAGDNSLSIRGDEAELGWRIVTPFLQAWADGLVPMQDHPAGSNGPPHQLDRSPDLPLEV